MIPIPTPTQKTLMTGDGIEVEDKRGAVRRLSGDKLRVMSADTLAAIADKFGGEKMAQMLYELCEANCTTNGGKVIADNRTRLAALTLAMAYLIGRPVERQEILTVNMDADSAVGMEERLRHSPALRAMFRKMLDRVDNPDSLAADSLVNCSTESQKQ
jgi:hypothetical protein